MKAVFTVIDVHSEVVYAGSSPESRIMLRAEREVAPQNEAPPNAAEQYRQQVERLHDSKQMDDDTYRVVKKSVVQGMAPLFAVMEAMQQQGASGPERMYVELELTEEEFHMMGSPTFGTKIEVEVGNPNFGFGVSGPARLRDVTGPSGKKARRTDPQTLDYALPRVKAAIDWLSGHEEGGKFTIERLRAFLAEKEGMMKEPLVDNALATLYREGYVWETKPGVYRRVR